MPLIPLRKLKKIEPFFSLEISEIKKGAAVKTKKEKLRENGKRKKEDGVCDFVKEKCRREEVLITAEQEVAPAASEELSIDQTKLIKYKMLVSSRFYIMSNVSGADFELFSALPNFIYCCLLFS